MPLLPALAAASALLASMVSPGRTLVAPLRRGPGASAELARALTEALAYDVREVSGSQKVLSPADVRALEAMEAEAAKLGSADVRVLERVSRTLGAGELVEGTFGRVGDRYLLDVRRLDVRRATVLQEGRAAPTSLRQAALLQAVHEVVSQLYPGRAALAAPPMTPARTLGELFARLEKAEQAETIYWSLGSLSGAAIPAAPSGPIAQPPSPSRKAAALAIDPRALDAYRQWLSALAERSGSGDPYRDQLAHQGVRGFTTSDELAVELGSGLAWQRAVAAEKMTQQQARRYCQELKLAGRTGFRLPGKSELLGLVRKSHEPTIDPAAFPETPLGWTWAEEGPGPGFGWAVSFLSGEAYTSAVNDRNHVRCVEGRPVEPAADGDQAVGGTPAPPPRPTQRFDDDPRFSLDDDDTDDVDRSLMNTDDFSFDDGEAF